MKYCLVLNNQIVRKPQELPQNWQNVSNFNLLSDEELKTYGWLPHTLIDNKGENKILVSINTEILDREVIETKVYRDMTQDEINQINQNIILNKWNQIRQKRNRLLKDSDWTQLPDSPVDINSWVNYRTQLRNLPQNFSEPDSVIWPQPPN